MEDAAEVEDPVNVKTIQSKFSINDAVQSMTKILNELGLFHFQLDSWFIIQRNHFDLCILNEPYQAIQVLFDTLSGQYFQRVWGKNKQKGTFDSLNELVQLCWDTFYETVPCAGSLDMKLTEDEEDHFIAEYPFARKVSKYCELLYQLQEDSNSFELQGIGFCARCSQLAKIEMNPLDMSPLPPSEFKEEVFEPVVQVVEKSPVKKRRGRKRKVAHKPLEEFDQEDLEIEQALLESIKDAVDSVDTEEDSSKEAPQKRTYNKNKRSPFIKQCMKKIKPKMVDNKKVFICDVCDNTYFSLTAVCNHKRRKHMFNEFHCSTEECDFVIDFPQPLLDHITQNHPSSQWADCPLCKVRMVLQSEDFIKHYQKCVKRAQLQDSQEKYQRLPKDKQTKKKTHICEVCGSGFQSKFQLAEHMYRHTGEKPYKCDQCDFATIYKYSLPTHIKKFHPTGKQLEEEEEPVVSFPCEICGKMLSSKSILAWHIRRVHHGLSDNVKCEQCGETFDRKSSMDRHINIVHSADPRLGCTECGQRCGDRYQLKRHMAKHFAPRFECKICGKGLKKKETLEAHERTHTGERPFRCKYCDYACMSNATLTLHRKFKHPDHYNRRTPKVEGDA